MNGPSPGTLPRALVFALAFGLLALAWVAGFAIWRYQDFADGVAALEPRVFEGLTLVTAGTGDVYENPDRLGPVTVVGLDERAVLVDAGRATAEALRAARIPVSQPDTVFLTSLLPENTLGLDDLLLTGWMGTREAPLRIVGPPGTRALVEGLRASHAAGVEARARATGRDPAGAGAEVEEVGDGWSARSGALSVRAAALPGGPLPGRAYRFEAGGRALVVGGPGWAPDALAALAEGAHVLVHAAVHAESVALAVEQGGSQASVLEREADLHTSTAEVGAIARRAGVGTLVLTRLRPPPLFDLQYTRLVGEDFGGDVVIASDGDTIRP